MHTMLGFDSPALPPFIAPFTGEGTLSTGGAGTGIGIGTAVQEGRAVVLTDGDLRHGTLVAGRTGVGKSKLAEWVLRQLLIRRSVQPDSGSTFVFDPHWSLARDVIDFACACELDLPIYTLDPAADPVVAYDPIRSNPCSSSGVVADQFAKWMAHAWRRSDDEAAPLLESNLKLIVRTLLDARLTLAHASTLVDPDAPASLRARIVASVADPTLRSKWGRLLASSPAAFMSQFGSAARALARLPPRANLLLGQPQSFSFREAMDAGAVVFIRTGGEDGVGPTLASILLDDLWNAVRGRGEGQSPVHVLVDEFTQLCGPHTVEMINGGRKFDTRLILLMQSARQLKHLGAAGRQAFEEVMLNCHNKLCMSVDAASAGAMADEIGTPAARLTKLGRMRAIVHALSMPPGVGVEIATTPVMPTCVSLSEREAYLARMIARRAVPFAYAREEAAANISRWQTPVPPTADPSPPTPPPEEPDEFTRVIRDR